MTSAPRFDVQTFFSDPLLVTMRDAAHIAVERMGYWSARLAETRTRALADQGQADQPSDDSPSLVEAKDNPNDLVTIADAEIEALVAHYLRTRRPADTMIGEEGVAARPLAEAPHAEHIASGLHVAEGQQAPDEHARRIEWHVDPIDGTVNFVRGIEQHCFSIGGRDLDTGEWVAGLVAAPALRSVWFARAGAGAWRTDALPAAGAADAAPVDHAAPVGPADSRHASGTAFTRLAGTPAGRRGRVVATGFGYAPERRAVQFAALVAIMEEFDDLRRAGSAAIDLCMAAEGRVNAYYERGLGVYDWAGGAVIAQEAGLHIERPVDRADPLIAADTSQTFEFIRARA